VSNTSEFRKIAFLGDYLPRKCGIATFTSDLLEGIAAGHPKTECFVVPEEPALSLPRLPRSGLAGLCGPGRGVLLVNMCPPDPSEQQKHRAFQSLGHANLRRIVLSNQSFERHLNMRRFGRCIARMPILRRLRRVVDSVGRSSVWMDRWPGLVFAVPKRLQPGLSMRTALPNLGKELEMKMQGESAVGVVVSGAAKGL